MRLTPIPISLFLANGFVIESSGQADSGLLRTPPQALRRALL